MLVNFELEIVDNQDFSAELTIVLYDLKNVEKFFIAFTKCGLGLYELAKSHDSRMVEYKWYCPCGACADVV